MGPGSRNGRGDKGLGKKIKKELCKWGKGSYGKNVEDLAPLVQAPQFFCTTCGRVSRFKKYLCDPKKLPAAKDEDKAQNKTESRDSVTP